MKTVGRLILSAIILVLTGLLAAMAKYSPELVFAFYPEFSSKALGAIAKLTAPLPFAVWEVLVVLLVLVAIYTLVRTLSQKRGFLAWLSGVVLTASCLVFLFVGLWGLNHYGPELDARLGLEVREYSKQELEAATRYYADQVNALADQVDRDENDLSHFADFNTLSQRAAAGYQALAGEYPMFAGAEGRVKRLASWPLFSRFGITGIFVCFTAESCVNPDTYETWIPFTMCHELAHRQAVAAEDEANFCAYLACMAQEDVQFRYSGAFAAFIYCSNALTKADREAAAEVWASIHPGVLADVYAANDHYAKYEGEVQEAAQKVNDAYLKAFSQEDGVQSYGAVADLLIAWYLEKNV